jgi:hypothetical protein
MNDAAVASPAVAPTRRRAHWSDRMNPILVRETLQSLNGRGFAGALLVTLLGVALIAVATLNTSAPHQGRGIGARTFQLLFCYVFLPVVLAIVPFQAFSSMRAEMQGGTAELLLLSNLTPAKIVRGRVLAVGGQFFLWLAVFAPMLALTYLLRGVSVEEILVSIGLAAVFAVSATALMTALGAFTRWKPAAVLANAIAGVGLAFGAFGIMMGFPHVVQGFISVSRESFAVEAIGTMAIVFAASIVLLLLVGQSQLTHPNENRSTPFRVFFVLLLAAAYGWIAFVAPTTSSDARLAPSYGALTFGLPFLLLPPTEEERLSPRVRTLVPRNPILAFLAVPFLPGRGRGYLFTLLILAALLIANHFALASTPPGAIRIFEAKAPWLGAAYVIIYAGIGSLLRSRFRTGTTANWIARILMVIVLALASVLPVLIQGLLSNFRGVRWGPVHVLNPFWTIEEFDRGRARPDVYLAALAAATILANVPAIVRGIRETMEASAARRARAG